MGYRGLPVVKRGYKGLSPLLFNLYVNDLPSSFQNTLSDPIILPNGTKLNSFLYSDDLIIISRSKIGLQNCLNTLSSFCKLRTVSTHYPLFASYGGLQGVTTGYKGLQGVTDG